MTHETPIMIQVEGLSADVAVTVNPGDAAADAGPVAADAGPKK